MLTVVRGHVSPETALVVEDYPYGRTLRCKIRYWVETKPGHGQRFVSQTTNPKKGNDWTNKPKPSVYQGQVIMVRDERGYVYYRCLGVNPWPEDVARFISEGIYSQLNEEERKRTNALITVSRRCSPKYWGEWDALVARCKGVLAGTLEPDQLVVGGSVSPDLFDTAIAQARAELFGVFQDVNTEGQPS